MQCSINNNWCPECALNRENITIEDMKSLATQRNGKCLSEFEEDINGWTLLLWECEHGHQWESIPMGIIFGWWCPACRENLKGQPIEQQMYLKSIKDMQKVAQSRDGECLSTEYINSKTKLKWRCELGHE